MTSVFKKLVVLLWKCVILRKRNWLLTIFELLSPILVVMLLYVLNKFAVEHMEENMAVEYVKPTNNTNEIRLMSSLTNIYKSLVNMEESTYVAYTPQTAVTDRLMRTYKSLSEHNQKLRVEAERSEADLEEALREHLPPNSNYSCVLGVVFSDPTVNFKYKILGNFDSTQSPHANSMLFKLQVYLDAQYLKSVSVNYNNDKVFIGEFLQSETVPHPVKDKPKSHKEIQKLVNLFILYIFLTLAYTFLVTAVVRDTIQEKSSGIKELMRIMGLASWMIWIHWFIYSMFVQIPVTVVITVLLTAIHPQVFEVNAFIVWLLLFLVTVDYIVIFFCVTCFFDRPTLGTTLCVLGWIIINFAMLAVLYPEQHSFPMQVLISLNPLVNICWAMHSIDSFQMNKSGWNLSDLFSAGYAGSQVSAGLAIVILICEIILFSLLLAYFDAVMPGRYGVAKPLTFILGPCVKLWQKRKQQSSGSETSSLPPDFELPPPGSKVGIRIRALHKEFGVFKKVVAVESVNLDIYEGEVTVLLGHNGAGKTTTMSMITGMFSPTSGIVSVDDKNIYDNLYNFRQNLGLCTQHNLFFPKLTVIEHLVFFGMLKGRSRSQAKEEGRYLLYMLNLIDKQNCKGSKLSGGMLRRLCLSVALTGGPKVLILDEPTSGLDPENRRHIWDIILSLRGERTILITTHYMEEADVLGDRIAIMDHGKVVCSGTTMFLKKIYGTGYNIHVSKNQRASVQDITQSIQRYIPQFKTKVVSPLQVDFSIKDDYVERFPDLFATLESSMSSLGMTAISVSCTTMEDVFLRVAELSEDQDHHELNSGNVLPAEYSKVEGAALALQRVEALVLKRVMYISKHYISTIIKLIIACLFVLAAILLTEDYKYKGDENGGSVNQAKTDISFYPDSISPIIYDELNKNSAEIAKSFIESRNGQALMMKFDNSSQFESIYQPMNKLLTEMANNTDVAQRVVLAATFIKNDFLIQYQPVLNPFASSNAANLMTNVLLQRVHPLRHVEVIRHFLGFKQRKCKAYSQRGNFAVTTFFWTAFIPCALTLVMANVIPLTVEESVTGFKYQQIIAGVSPLVYRLSSFLCDFCLYIIFVIISFVIILIFGSDVMPLSSEHMRVLFLVLLLFGASSIVFLSVFSSWSKNPAIITGTYIALNFAFMLVCPISIIIMQVHGTNIYIQILFTVILSFHPTGACFFAIYCIATGIANDSVCLVNAGLKSYFGLPTESNRLSIFVYVLLLILDTILYSFVIFLLDYKIFAKMMYKRSGIYDCQWGDNDVKFETERVRMFKEANVDTVPLRVEGLVKKYHAFKAANQVSFLVTKGECFGLLGVNGAGKTTTFKMLTAEITPSSGDAYSTKYSVVSQTQRYLSNIGYCPQFDALLDNLTGNNILTIIAKLRGVPRKDVRNQVDFWMRCLGIEEHAKKCTKTYSGGTKRKLGTAMAFIGEPVVALLDEPTTGVDPAARRKVWSAVKDRQSSGYSAVLSSHSMEECEALCTRLTIMRQGELCCIGSVQELKTKFGQGYVVLLKLTITQDYETQLASLKREFVRCFPKSVVQDENINMITYRVLDGKTPLSYLFSEVIRLKKKYKVVEDFIVSNATLEQLFLAIARGHDIRTSISDKSMNPSKKTSGEVNQTLDQKKGVGFKP